MRRSSAAASRGKVYCLGGALAVLACIATQEARADECEMTLQTLSSVTAADLRIDILGTPVLCLSPMGYDHLMPYTATAQITNLGQRAEITYALAPLRSFHSTAVWPATAPDARTALTPPPAAGAERRRCDLETGETCRISSWTRHHHAIWTLVENRNVTTDGSGEIYLVQFDLRFALDRGDEPVAVSRQINISFEVRRTP